MGGKLILAPCAIFPEAGHLVGLGYVDIIVLVVVDLIDQQCIMIACLEDALMGDIG